MNRPADTRFGPLRADLRLATPLGPFLGAERIALLEAIRQQGAISRAARAVGLSYKAAWDAVDDMNNLAQAPLVERRAGGPRGGGTCLTPYGERLVAFYRTVADAHQASLARLQQALSQTPAADVADFGQLLRRFSLQTSARNQFVGRITGLQTDAVEASVQLTLAPGLTLTAVVTRESVQQMRLQLGSEVQALVKSSSVMLAKPGAARLSARNQLAGRVSRIVRGPVNADVSIELPGQTLQLAAVITDDSVQGLALAVGSEVLAIFQASSVVLVTTA